VAQSTEYLSAYEKRALVITEGGSGKAFLKTCCFRCTRFPKRKFSGKNNLAEKVLLKTFRGIYHGVAYFKEIKEIAVLI